MSLLPLVSDSPEAPAVDPGPGGGSAGGAGGCARAIDGVSTHDHEDQARERVYVWRHRVTLSRGRGGPQVGLRYSSRYQLTWPLSTILRLDTPRLILRPPRAEDLDAWTAMMQDERRVSSAA